MLNAGIGYAAQPTAGAGYATAWDTPFPESVRQVLAQLEGEAGAAGNFSRLQIDVRTRHVAEQAIETLYLLEQIREPGSVRFRAGLFVREWTRLQASGYFHVDNDLLGELVACHARDVFHELHPDPRVAELEAKVDALTEKAGDRSLSPAQGPHKVLEPETKQARKRRAAIQGLEGVFLSERADDTVVYEVSYRDDGRQKWRTFPDSESAVAFRESKQTAGVS